MRSWGYPVVEASNLAAASNYLAGSDEERLAGLKVLLDAGVRWIFAARGGFGVTRLLDRLPLREMAERGVSFVGYSDLTALLNVMLNFKEAAPQIHAPVVTELAGRPDDAEILRNMLETGGPGDMLFSFEAENFLREGDAEGWSAGGNLSLLAALAGTKYQPDFQGSVLFLEEVKEPAYRIDRMLTQLATSGMLRGVRAVICGRMKACGEDARQAFRLRLLELLPPRVPILDMMAFGHGAGHRAIPLGVRVEVESAGGRVMWRS